MVSPRAGRLRFTFKGCLGASITLLIVAACVTGFFLFAVDQYLRDLTHQAIRLPPPTWGPGDAMAVDGHMARSFAELVASGKTRLSMSESELGAALDHGLPMVLRDLVRLRMLDRFLHVQLSIDGHAAAQHLLKKWPAIAWYVDRRLAHINFDAIFAFTTRGGTLVPVVQEVIEPSEMGDSQAVDVICWLMHDISRRLERAQIEVKSCIVDRGRITFVLEKAGVAPGPPLPAPNPAPSVSRWLAPTPPPQASIRAVAPSGPR